MPFGMKTCKVGNRQAYTLTTHFALAALTYQKAPAAHFETHATDCSLRRIEPELICYSCSLRIRLSAGLRA